MKVSRVQSCMQCMGDTVGPHWGALAWGASRRHWCLKSMKSGFARAKVPCLKNLDVLSARIDAKKLTDDTLKNSKENVGTEDNRG